MLKLLGIFCLVSLTLARVYTEANGDGKYATLYASPINGNYQGNSPVRNRWTIDGHIGQAMRNTVNIEESYIDIDSAVIKFSLINPQAHPTFTLTCNGSPVTVTGSAFEYSADVTEFVRNFSQPSNSKLLTFRISGSAVVAGADKAIFRRPRIVIKNRDIPEEFPDLALDFVTLSANSHPIGSQLSTAYNVSYYSAGYLGSDLVSVSLLIHAEPSTCEAFLPILHEFQLKQQATGEHRRLICLNAAGSSPKIINPTVASTPAGLWTDARALNQVFFDQVLRPMCSNIDIDGREWHSRDPIHLALDNPGLINDILLSTPTYQPCIPEYQSRCTYLAPGEGTPITSALLSQAGFGSIPCAANDTVNWAPIMGAEGIADPAFTGVSAAYGAKGYCSVYGPLPKDLSQIQNPVGHTEFDFSQYLACDAGCDPILGPGAGFMIRCEAKFGPYGLATAQGQNALFGIRRYTDKEIERLNRPTYFPGHGVDAHTACLGAIPGSAGPSLMPLPDIAQMFAATARTDPFEPHATIWGTLPGAMEVPQVRADHDLAVAALKSGDVQRSITGKIYLFVQDNSLKLPGDPADPLRGGLMPWMENDENMNIWRAINTTLISGGQSGGHVDTGMSQPYLNAKHIWDIASS